MKGLLLVASLLPAISLAAPPALPAPTGWAVVGETEVYDRSNAFEAINGAAEQYIAGGMTALTMANLKDGRGAEVGVRVFTHERPIDAFGAYQRLRDPKGRTLKAGARASIASGDFCLGFDGTALVELRPVGEALTAKTCTAVLSGLLSALPGPKGMPAALKLLPAEGRVPGSEGFARASYLGTRDLSHCLYASYTHGGKTVVRFVMLPAPGTALAARLKAMNERWKASTVDGRTVLSRKVPYQGVIALRPVKAADGTVSRITGVAGVADLATAVALMLAPSAPPR